MVREPSFAGYYSKVYALYDGLREMQKTIPQRLSQGESKETLAAEAWALLLGIQ